MQKLMNRSFIAKYYFYYFRKWNVPHNSTFLFHRTRKVPNGTIQITASLFVPQHFYVNPMIL